MAKKKIIIKVPVPKIRKPVAKKPNTVMKTKKDYRRKDRGNKGDRHYIPEE